MSFVVIMTTGVSPIAGCVMAILTVKINLMSRTAVSLNLLAILSCDICHGSADEQINLAV